MSGFVGKASNNMPLLIERSGFWPGIDVNDFRKKMRVLDSVENEQAEMSLLSALDHTIFELVTFETKYAEYDQLENVPSQMIAGRSRYVYNFERAVYSTAKALLLEDYADMDMTRKPGEDRVVANDPKVAELRKQAYAAIQMFFGESPIFVALV